MRSVPRREIQERDTERPVEVTVSHWSDGGPGVRTAIVVPCFNESERLDFDAFERWLGEMPDAQLLFVDDGSTDHTRSKLDAFAAAHEPVVLIGLDRNYGKGEAVRQGVIQAAQGEAEYIGFWDADLATPLDEIARFVAELDERPGVDWVFGSRVNLLGRSIRRHLGRHYVGRVFASLVAAGLALPIYDSQCGAKLFRSTPSTVAVFERRFTTRWIFDVELLERVLLDIGNSAARERIREFPLESWKDVHGSTLTLRQGFVALGDLAGVVKRYRKGITS